MRNVLKWKLLYKDGLQKHRAKGKKKLMYFKLNSIPYKMGSVKVRKKNQRKQTVLCIYVCYLAYSFIMAH